MLSVRCEEIRVKSVFFKTAILLLNFQDISLVKISIERGKPLLSNRIFSRFLNDLKTIKTA